MCEADAAFGGAIIMNGFVLADGNAGGAPISAAGSDQAGATEARYQYSIVNGGTGGVRLFPASFPVTPMMVLNKSGSAINVYPPTGARFDALAANTAISLPNGSVMLIYFSGNVGGTNTYYTRVV